MMRNLLGAALAGFLVLGVAGSAGAVTVDYTGTFSLVLSSLPGASGPDPRGSLVRRDAGQNSGGLAAVPRGSVGPPRSADSGG